MAGFDDYSLVPEENGTIAGVNIAEGCPPSSVNNAIRQLMADGKRLAQIGGGSGAASAGTVDGSTYAGTTEDADPDRIDNDNVKLMNAQADVTNPLSPNFGKTVVWPAGKGSGQRDPAEWNNWYPKAGATYADSKDPAQIVNGKKPIDPNFMTEVGDYTFYAWSQNGRVTSENPVTIVEQGQHPGNLDPRVNHVFLVGARCRRPKMPIIAPECLCFDPNKTAATTKNGIDTQTAVKRGGSITGLVTLGGVHYLGRNNHFNDLSLNGVGDYTVQMRSWGPRCDPCYIGAGNVGDGTWNRHNLDITVDIWADGWNANNRNGLSIVDGTRITGKVVTKNMGQKGGAGPVDSFNPETGVSAPAGGVDIEPNGFTDDPWVQDIKLYVECENSGTGAVATLLLDNDTIPTPIQNIELHVTSRNNYRGCHVSSGGTFMRTPYDIRVYPYSEGDFRPFELLAGQGIRHINGTYLRSFAAGLIGYSDGSYPHDLWFDDMRMQELGTGDSSGVEVRGWAGGGMSGDVVNCKVVGFKWINGRPIRDLTVNLRPKNVDEITSVNNCRMDFLHQVLSVDGGALIEPSGFNDCSPLTDFPNDGWAVNGAVSRSIPGAGLWKTGDFVRHRPDGEPGSPAVSRCFKTNTSGVPFFVQELIHQGFEEPLATGFESLKQNYVFTRMRSHGNGKISSIGPNATMVRSGSSSSAQIIGNAPYRGTRAVFVFITTNPNPTQVSDILLGIGFTEGIGAIAIASGSPASARVDTKYGDEFVVAGGQNGSGSVSINGTTLYSTGLPNTGLYNAVLINTIGESVVIKSVNAN